MCGTSLLRLRIWGFTFFQMLPWYVAPILYLYLVSGEVLSFLEFSMLLGSLCIYYFFGTLLNDFFDKPHDLQAGRPTGIEKFSDTCVCGMCGLFLGALLLTAFSLGWFSLLLYGLGVLSTAFYSHKKIRLKEKGIWGPLSNDLAELFPFVVILHVFNYFGLEMILYGIFFFINSLTGIVNHQIISHALDSRGGLHTFVIQVGLNRARKILYLTSAISTSLFFLFSGIFCTKIPNLFFIILFLFLLYTTHPLLNPEIWKAFELPRFYVTFIYFGLVGVFPLYFALMLLFHRLEVFYVSLIAFLCELKFISVIVQRIVVLLK